MWLWLVQRKRMAQFDPRYENMCGVGLTAALVNPYELYRTELRFCPDFRLYYCVLGLSGTLACSSKRNKFCKACTALVLWGRDMV